MAERARAKRYWLPTSLKRAAGLSPGTRLMRPTFDLQVFFDYLIASIRQRRSDFGKQTLRPLLRSADAERISLLAEAFVYELLEGKHEPLLIVIEDLHLVCDAPWVVAFFRRLLPLLPADVHMLITSRTLPPAPLWRMRSKQRLYVIDEETLAFNRAEATELFEKLWIVTRAGLHSRGPHARTGGGA